MNRPRLRHAGYTHPRSWWVWRFISLNLFQIASASLFLTAFILAALGVPGVSPGTTTEAAMAAAGVSYMLLLAAPARRWVRVCSVIAPLLAVGARLSDIITSHPVQPFALLTWSFIAFTLTAPALRLMPPPLTNGERRRWIETYERGRTGGLG